MESQISTPEGIFKIVPQMLADVKVRLDLETSSITLPCTVQQTLAPTPRTTIRYDIPDGSSPKIQGLLFLLQWGTEPTHAMITHQGNQFRTQLLLHRTTPYVEFLIQELESLNDEDAKQTHEIGFKVINMKDTTLLGEHLASERGEGEQFGATVLSDNEWTIQLRQAPNHREAQRYLETLGGYQITHIGSIYKKDGSPFSQKVAQEEINILRSFLSFSNGSFVGLTEIQGAGQNFQPLWQVWRDHNVGWSNGSTNHSWIHAHGTNHEENEMMASLFPAFSREYQSDRNLPSLVYRYLQANQTQPDIDLQTAQSHGTNSLETGPQGRDELGATKSGTRGVRFEPRYSGRDAQPAKTAQEESTKEGSDEIRSKHLESYP